MTTIPSEDHHQHRTQNVPQVMTGGDSGIASSCERPKKESDVDDAQSLSPTTKGCCTPPTINFGGEECCEKRKSRSCGSGGGVRQKITHVYCGFSQSLLLENTASVARDHLGKLLLFFSYLCNSPRLQRERERERERTVLFVCDGPKNTYQILIANERTFLAWLRTSMALITVGVGKAIDFSFCLPRKG